MASNVYVSVLLAIFLFIILVCLAAAGFFMLRRKPAEQSGMGVDAHGDLPAASNKKRMVWALTVRISFSVALFVFVILGWHFGWIRPMGIPLR